jgi:hypothetical protein
MLNDAQRTSLRIALTMTERKMRAIEARLLQREERGLMYEIGNDVTVEMAAALHHRIHAVYALISELKSRLGLPRESKPASREINEGLAILWVTLQESDTRALRRYGEVDRRLAPVLDPHIEALAQHMLALEDLVTPAQRPSSVSVGTAGRPSRDQAG